MSTSTEFSSPGRRSSLIHSPLTTTMKFMDSEEIYDPVADPAEEGSAAEAFSQKSGQRTRAGNVSIDLLRSLYLGQATFRSAASSSRQQQQQQQQQATQVFGQATAGGSSTSPVVSSSHKIAISRRNSSVIYPGVPPDYPPVKRLSPLNKKRILVTGGAGFVGSHLCDRLLLMGHDVIAIDNFFTGTKSNLAHWFGHPNFEIIRHDVVDPIMLEVDQIYHLACPASPVHYQMNPVKTLKTGFFGTYNMLGLAKRVKARFLLSSTSEVYGDPEEHPQRETYWGHVNCIGPRACYDEGKRVAEALAYSYARQDGVDIRVARIFNTFGPRMNWNDGRVVSNFIVQALQGKDITIYGDGSATRSFQYIHDLVDGLIALMESDCTEPVNLGNPEEYTIKTFAEVIAGLVKQHREKCGEDGETSKIVYLDAVKDDPQKRKPDTTKAKEVLNWSPQWSATEGLTETVAYFHKTMHNE